MAKTIYLNQDNRDMLRAYAKRHHVREREIQDICDGYRQRLESCKTVGQLLKAFPTMARFVTCITGKAEPEEKALPQSEKKVEAFEKLVQEKQA